MRHVAIVFSLALVGGCGSNGISNNDGAASVDMAVTNDLASAGDMPIVSMSCDPVKQNCADTTQKCVLAASGMTLTQTCVPLSGMVAEGGACMRVNMMLGMDNCDKGLECTARGATSSFCRKLCKADTDCSGGQKCSALSSMVASGYCVPTCTPFGTDCPGGLTCSSFTTGIGSTMTNLKVIPLCRAAGASPAFGNCMRSTDCVANTFCDQTMQCTPICNDTHACTQPPGGVADGGAPLTCMPLGNLPMNGGLCG